MALLYVYRRPFDYRAPVPQWLLLRPDLSVNATAAALILAGQTGIATLGKVVESNAASLALSGQVATISGGLTVLANAGTMEVAGATALTSFLDTTAFTYRDLGPLVPILQPGVYRRSFTVKRLRPPTIIPRQVASGSIVATRAQLTLNGEHASVTLDELIRTWILQEAVRNALLRRQIAYRAPLDMRPWDARIAQFTVPTNNLTAYAGALTLSGAQSTVNVFREVAANLLQLSIGRPAAAVRLGKSILASAAALTLSGQNARVSTGRTVLGAAYDLTLTGQQAASHLNRGIQAGAANLILSGLASSFGNHLNVAAKVSVLAITGRQATARVEKAVASLAAALSLNAHGATTSVSNAISSTEAQLTLSGQIADVQIVRMIEAAFAELSLNERTALIEGTQAVIVQIGRRTVRVRARNSTITVH